MQKLKIIKVGGKVVENEVALQQLLTDFVQIPELKLLVHGGGKLATELSARLGIETKMVNGRRITDAETLQIVTMVYAGLVNKNIVAKLQARGVNALGICGADLNLIQAHKRPVKDGIDYGFVGDIDKVSVDKLKILLQNDILPVVAPLTHDNNGQLFNTNADTIPQAIAIALSSYFEIDLIYCFEKKGVLLNEQDDNSVISQITPELFKQYVNDGIISAGMIPKLENGFNALHHGVKRVIITNTQSVGNLHQGTTLTLL